MFLRASVLLGRITLEQEQMLIDEMNGWLVERADELPAFRTYLEQWGDWRNPWAVSEEAAANDTAEPARPDPSEQST